MAAACMAWVMSLLSFHVESYKAKSIVSTTRQTAVYLILPSQTMRKMSNKKQHDNEEEDGNVD